MLFPCDHRRPTVSPWLKVSWLSCRIKCPPFLTLIIWSHLIIPPILSLLRNTGCLTWIILLSLKLNLYQSMFILLRPLPSYIWGKKVWKIKYNHCWGHRAVKSNELSVLYDSLHLEIKIWFFLKSFFFSFSSSFFQTNSWAGKKCEIKKCCLFLSLHDQRWMNTANKLKLDEKFEFFFLFFFYNAWVFEYIINIYIGYCDSPQCGDYSELM